MQKIKITIKKKKNSEHLIKPRPNLLNKVVNKDYHFKVLVIGKYIFQ